MAFDAAVQTVKPDFRRTAKFLNHSNSHSADEVDMRHLQYLALEISRRSVQRSR
jgi:hypothetical protein